MWTLGYDSMKVNSQMQPTEVLNIPIKGIPLKRCSEKFRKIHRKTTRVPESLF